MLLDKKENFLFPIRYKFHNISSSAGSIIKQNQKMGILSTVESTLTHQQISLPKVVLVIQTAYDKCHNSLF